MNNIAIRKGTIVASTILACVYGAASMTTAHAQSTERSSRSGERIVGGTLAETGEYPWAVSLQRVRSNGTSRHSCGGSLVSPFVNDDDAQDPFVSGWSREDDHARWVLTAAHCVTDRRGTAMDAGKFRVVSGVSDLTDSGARIEQNVERVLVHPRYEPRSNRNDLALLKLDELDPRHRANRNRRPVQLPDVLHVQWISRPYTALTVAGWGRKREGGFVSQDLRKVIIPLVDPEVCTATYRNAGKTITGDMLCAGYQTGGFDSCQGDSGGPIFYAPAGNLGQPVRFPVLAGVVSWGIGCARGGGLFGVYSRVTENADWIGDTIIANR